MADLLPSTPDSSVGEDGDPRVIGVDSEDADDLLAALQSDTARELLAALYDDPATPSGLADEVDTSIQNVRYHLEKLTDADLVEVADTVYSEKGREMKVYAPAAKPLVVFAGGDDEAPGLEAALSRLLGGLGVLGLSSLVVQHLVGEGSVVPDVTFGGAEPGAQPTTEPAGGANLTGNDVSVTNVEVETGSATTVAEEAATAGRETTATGDDAATPTAADATTTEDAGGGIFNVGDTTTVERTTAEAAETTAEAAETTAETAETTAEAAETTAETGTVTEATRAAPETTRTVIESAGTETVTESAGTEGTYLVEETTQATEAVRATTEQAGRAGGEPATTTAVEAAGAATAGLPPGLVFFAGGLVVLAALGVAWYLRER